MYRENNDTPNPFFNETIDPAPINRTYHPDPSWPYPHDHDPSNIMIPGNDWEISRRKDNEYYW